MIWIPPLAFLFLGVWPWKKDEVAAMIMWLCSMFFFLMSTLAYMTMLGY